MVSISIQKLYSKHFVSTIFFALFSIGLASPTNAQSFYNLPLDIESYCRNKFGSNAFSHTIGNNDAYSWRCSVSEQVGGSWEGGVQGGVGQGGVNGGGSYQNSRIDRPVSVNDVCQWQYGQNFRAYQVNETSGGWKCENPSVPGPRPR